MKDTFKVGDIVIVTEKYHTNSAEVGMLVQITKYDKNGNIPFLVQDFLKIYNWDFNYATWCRNVRLATKEEILSVEGEIKQIYYEVYD